MSCGNRARLDCLEPALSVPNDPDHNHPIDSLAADPVGESGVGGPPAWEMAPLLSSSRASDIAAPAL